MFLESKITMLLTIALNYPIVLFKYNDDCCSTMEEMYSKNTVSITEVNITDEILTIPAYKLDIFFTGDLFTPEKRFKSLYCKLKRSNLCNIKSNCVYYKVSHKQKNLDDQVAADKIDMHLLKETCSEFIQCVSDPKEKDFETYLFISFQKQQLFSDEESSYVNADDTSVDKILSHLENHLKENELVLKNPYFLNLGSSIVASA
ncbi:Hypothetical protein CINCED_3A017885 [Cinara cedri]|uniref:Uncharacterized protein n=1 Tax=Cinara cedri TaxID=506608 RepID=A0A5E4NQJ3_9HEMI|nr:Hypothetical protein CINCED_3A017885 [Cinara cedri]